MAGNMRRSHTIGLGMLVFDAEHLVVDDRGGAALVGDERGGPGEFARRRSEVVVPCGDGVERPKITLVSLLP